MRGMGHKLIPVFQRGLEGPADYTPAFSYLKRVGQKHQSAAGGLSTCYIIFSHSLTGGRNVKEVMMYHNDGGVYHRAAAVI